MQKINIVLSGESLRGARLGESIDKADLIVRLHDSQWQNIEDHGGRFDLGVLPAPWLGRALKQCRRLPDKKWLVYNWAYQKNPVRNYVSLLNRPVINYYYEDSRVYFSPDKAPSRGFMSILACLEIFPKHQIFVYGGDSLRTGELTNYYTGRRIKNNPRHNFKHESILLSNLKEKRLIFI